MTNGLSVLWLPHALILAATMLPGAASAAPAPISRVVVYADRAQVIRTQEADCRRGEVTFGGLPSTLDTRTLWAAIRGAGEVLGVSHREEATGPRAEAKEIQAQIRKIDRKMVEQSDRAAAARAKERKLASLARHMKQIWGLQAAGPKPPTASWDAALDLLRSQALAAALAQREAATARRELQQQRDEVADQLRLIKRKRRRTTYAVTAFLKCTGKRKVRLSYVVPHATWSISYQLRADPRRRRARLVAQATVQQSTGEDWKRVELAVSTANLKRKNTPPNIRKMAITSREPRDTRKVLVRSVERRRHLGPAGKLGALSNKLPTRGGQPQGPPEEAGLALELTAARRVTVPSDGSAVVVVLAERTSRAAFAFEGVPKLYPHVYRKVALRNPFGFVMLPGPLAIYRGRTFLGRARSERRAPGESFATSLGVENQLQVQRYVKEEKLDGPGTFGTKKVLRHRYVIQVGNWTRKAKRIRVLENIPVSKVGEIKVALGDATTPPTSWNKDDGILAWRLDVPPRSKRDITLAYTVTVPESYEVR